MPFQPIGPENLSEFLRLRLTATEKVRLAEDAKVAGVGMSELVRRRYFGRKIVARADHAQINALSQMIRELSRQGGLLKHIHNESGGAYSDATRAALDKVDQALADAKALLRTHAARAADQDA